MSQELAMPHEPAQQQEQSAACEGAIGGGAATAVVVRELRASDKPRWLALFQDYIKWWVATMGALSGGCCQVRKALALRVEAVPVGVRRHSPPCPSIKPPPCIGPGRGAWHQVRSKCLGRHHRAHMVGVKFTLGEMEAA